MATADNRVVNAFIEIPKGSRNKYEFDKETGRVVLDRVLYSAVQYPTEYGYIEETLADDGDPLDIMVLVTEPTVPGCVIPSRVIGLLEMADEKGTDNKLLAVPDVDPRFRHIKDLEQVPPHVLREIEHFFAVYKDLEGKKVTVGGWHGAEKAMQMLEDARRAYQKGR